MGYELRESSDHLLTCFFSECENQFRFLEGKYGYSRISGLVEYKSGRQVIKPFGAQSPEEFWAVTRYEKDDRALEILYGDKEFLIEGYNCFDRIHRLNLVELLWAAKKNDNAIASKKFLTHQENLKQAVEDFATGLKKYHRHLLEPNPKVIERAKIMRSKLMEQRIREEYKNYLQQVSMMAAKAFSEKDYLLVVEFFTPYEQDLSSGDLKKLQLARKKLLKTS